MSEESTTQHSASEASSFGKAMIESPRWLHVVLMIVAIASWMIFILACIGGPAWSPDGTQILFAYRDVQHSRNSVSIYDRNTGQFSVIFSQPAEKADRIAIEPQWQNDGTRALLTLYQELNSSDGSCELLSIPVKSSLPLQAYGLGSAAGCEGPHAQIGNKIFFGGERLRWVDLTTGEVESKSFGGEGLSVHPLGDRLAYVRQATRPQPGAPTDQAPEKGWEFGHISGADLELRSDFTVWATDHPDPGLQYDDLPPTFWDQQGSRLALVSNGDKTSVLLFDGSKGYERSLAPNLGVTEVLGNVVWSPDSSKLYASALVKTDSEDIVDYGLAEIPLDGSRGRISRIATIHMSKDDETAALFASSMHVSLSPDGTLIAATPAVLGEHEIAREDRALFLIDLRDPERHVQRIMIPNSPSDQPMKDTK